MFNAGINASLNSKKTFMVGMLFSKELRENQLPLGSRAISLTREAWTLSYKIITNPIMYYSGNTRPPETQGKWELKFNPNYYAGTIKQFLPQATIGYEVTRERDGSIKGHRKEGYYYGNLTFSLCRPEDKAAKSAIEDPSLKNLSEVPQITKYLIYSLLNFSAGKDSRVLRGKFAQALLAAVKIITDQKISGEAKNEITETFNYNIGTKSMDFVKEKSDMFNGDIEEFSKLVKAKGLDSDEATDKKSAIEGSIAQLRGDANKITVELISQYLSDMFSGELDKAKANISDDAKKEKDEFVTKNTSKFNDVLLSAYKQLALENMVYSEAATSKKQEIIDFINGLQLEAQTIQMALDEAAKKAQTEEELAAAKAAKEKLINDLLNRFREAYNREIEKALAIIVPQDPKAKFKGEKDETFKTLTNTYETALRSDFTKATNGIKIESFIAGLTPEANGIMINVIAGKLKGEFNKALDAALKIISVDEKKENFKQKSINSFNKLLQDYKDVAKDKLVTSDPAVKKEAEIENFIGGLVSAAIAINVAIAELNKQVRAIGAKYKSDMDGMISTAYKGIMDCISTPLSSKPLSLDLKDVTLDAVTKGCQKELSGYRKDLDARFSKFADIARSESEGLSSKEAVAAQKEIDDFMATLPAQVKNVLNGNIAATVKTELKTRCDAIYQAAVKEAENTTAQNSTDAQKKVAIDTFKSKNETRLAARQDVYTNIAMADLCSDDAQKALDSLFNCLGQLDLCKQRLIRKMKATLYVQLIAELWVDMTMEIINLNKNGERSDAQKDAFKKQCEEKFSSLTGVNIKNQEQMDMIREAGNTAGSILKKKKIFKFSPEGEGLISNIDEIKGNSSIYNIWQKTEKLIDGFRNDAKSFDRAQ